MWYDPILAYALDALVTLVIGLIALAVAYGTRYLRLLSNRLQEQVKHDLIANTIARLEKTVVVTVQAAEQKVAADLREKVKDGKIERSELLAVAENVKTEVLNTLGEEAVSVLQDTFGDINTLIENYIEATVLELKK